MGFTFPPHPAELANKEALVPCDRNPHDLPTFDSHTHPTSPVLYLPPLLSSLPDTFPPLALSPKNPPLKTETRLPDIDPASLSLHKALHDFHPLTSDYATTPYASAFNWAELTLPVDEERDWYCVVFKSKRKDGSDGGPLYEADRLAHQEAIQNGGLILYWYGVPDPDTGINLATCIWQSRKHAIAAMARPHHIQAMKLAAVSFEVYTLERFILRKLKDNTGVTLEEFSGGEVGW